MSFTHLIGWAIVRAAAEQPSMTHYFAEADGAPHRVDPGAVNLGLAVDVERRDGSRFLMVPVIKDADGMDFAEFHARYEELVEAARGEQAVARRLRGSHHHADQPRHAGDDRIGPAPDARAGHHRGHRRHPRRRARSG